MMRVWFFEWLSSVCVSLLKSAFVRPRLIHIPTFPWINRNYMIRLYH